MTMPTSITQLRHMISELQNDGKAVQKALINCAEWHRDYMTTDLPEAIHSAVLAYGLSLGVADAYAEEITTQVRIISDALAALESSAIRLLSASARLDDAVTRVYRATRPNAEAEFRI